VCFTGLTGIEPLSGSCSVSPAGTSLTGGAHRSDRCGSVDSRFGFSDAFLGSEGCVLEVAFVLLEFSSPSRRIFIGSHSLPPSLVRRISPSHVFVRGMQSSTDWIVGKVGSSSMGFGSEECLACAPPEWSLPHPGIHDKHILNDFC
jgi:hypothetical protein